MGDLERENEELQEKLEKSEHKASDLFDELGTSKLRIQSMTAEKLEADKKLNSQLERIKTLEKEVSKLTAESSNTKQQSKSVVEQNKINFQQSQLTSQENLRLQDEVR